MWSIMAPISVFSLLENFVTAVPINSYATNTYFQDHCLKFFLEYTKVLIDD